jgi:hypothetical protein
MQPRFGNAEAYSATILDSQIQQPMMSSKEAQRMALNLPIRTTGAFIGIGAFYADRFP